MKSRKKVAIGLSAGVDSSVSAYLLKKKGWDVTGITLKICPEQSRCQGSNSLEQISAFCCKLNIPYHIIDVENLFKEKIINYFINSYLRGVTPNPCAYCNRLIKFGFLLEKVRFLGIDYLATGHYSRIAKIKESLLLRKGKDKKKSQEYFLSLIEPSALSSLIFPLGNYTKEKVKKIAKEKKIIFSDKKESQDVCFIKGESYSQYIEKNKDNSYDYSGEIKHIKGKILGRHKGFYCYTLGQRAGLGVSWREPLYVVEVDSKTNTVIVAEKEFVYRKSFYVESLNWFLAPQRFKNIKVQVRYNSKLYSCDLDIKAKQARVSLKEKVEAIAPGQAAAFYYKDLLLGGGIISR
ncbi:MAG: tRNA 2-thiouridine(34) synthase MnmA [Candidatus Omnitrophota bacterium]